MATKGLNHCEWNCASHCRQYMVNPAISDDGCSSRSLFESFSFVSYNILAEVHRVRWDYSYTPEEFLCQEYRHGLLMKELQYLDGDVVCLQEVNPDYYNNTLLPDMKRLGYDGLMKCRTKEYFAEGEATFFKTEKFELVSSKEVELTEIAHCEIEKMSDMSPAVKMAAKDYLDRADVLLITCLLCKTSDRVITVGNVHLWWDDDLYPDVKTVQAAFAVQEVVRVSGIGGAYVICGDFNSDCTTPIYQLVIDGYLSESSVQALKGVQSLQLKNGLSKSLVDHYKAAVHHTATDLKSAYSSVLGCEPELTCYTGRGWQLDYIFYSSKTLVPLGILDIADKDVVVKTHGLPSKDFPSDHLSLKTVIAFT